MTTPFPGMDPYLEHPALWPDVHNRLIAAIGDRLGPILRPRYSVCLEERTYVGEPDELVFIGRPDIAVTAQPEMSERSTEGGIATEQALTVTVPVPDRMRETYLEVRTVGEGKVVTVLELLSPTNKRPGKGRELYEEKRMHVLETRTHLVEIDLLRAGDPMTVYGATRSSDYRILVSRGNRRPRASLFVFGVRDAIPSFRLPLRSGDEEPQVELGRILRELYDRAAYDLRVDYRKDPVPPLREEDRSWSRDLLKPA
ncbi:MAG: DUF4058 family protein [Planctomycetes bacterium]|nr:DUF4058 family protein [Planctomycetota bacterium]